MSQTVAKTCNIRLCKIPSCRTAASDFEQEDVKQECEIQRWVPSMMEYLDTECLYKYTSTSKYISKRDYSGVHTSQEVIFIFKKQALQSDTKIKGWVTGGKKTEQAFSFEKCKKEKRIKRLVWHKKLQNRLKASRGKKNYKRRWTERARDHYKGWEKVNVTNKARYCSLKIHDIYCNLLCLHRTLQDCVFNIFSIIWIPQSSGDFTWKVKEIFQVWRVVLFKEKKDSLSPPTFALLFWNNLFSVCSCLVLEMFLKLQGGSALF